MEQLRVSVGWAGKIPSAGDFVKAPKLLHVLRWFDGWAATGTQRIRDGGGRAADAFLTAPLVAFSAARGICGSKPAIGLIGPGMDRAERIYPFMIGAEGDWERSADQIFNDCTDWYNTAGALFLDALDPEFSQADLIHRSTVLSSISVSNPSSGLSRSAVVFGAAGQRAMRTDSFPPLEQILGISSTSGTANGFTERATEA